LKIIDLILLLLILIGAYRGFKKGLLVEILTLFALLIAIISGMKLTHSGVNYFSDSNPNSEKWLPFAVFLLIFILVFIGIFYLGKTLKNILDYTLIGDFDSWIGAVVGALKVAFGISLLLWLIHYAKIDIPKSYTADSIIYPSLIHFAPEVVRYVSYVIPFQDVFPLVQEALNE
jgi:membrane protein required for colicin V production